MEAIIEIERRYWRDRARLRPAEAKDFEDLESGSFKVDGVRILPPDCKDWVLIRDLNTGFAGELSSHTHRNTTLENIIKLAREQADGVRSVAFRPAFPDEIAKELSREDWAGVWKTFEIMATHWRSDTGFVIVGKYAPGIYSYILIVALALLTYFVTEWRVYAGTVLGLATVRLIYKIGVATGAEHGFSHGVETGLPLGIEKLTADLDKAEPHWRWRGIIANVGKPGQSK
jgi:hypothetical protein